MVQMEGAEFAVADRDGTAAAAVLPQVTAEPDRLRWRRGRRLLLPAHRNADFPDLVEGLLFVFG